MKNKEYLSNIFLVTVLFSFIAITSCVNHNSQTLMNTEKSDNTNVTKGNNKTENSPTPTPTDEKTTKIAQPEILSREAWKAKKPVGKGIKHTIEFITLHHSAVSQKPKSTTERKLRNLQNFSQSKEKLASGKTKPAWFDVPYHYYIAANGQIAEARQIEFAGDTNTNYDPKGHALIVLEGNFEKEKPTAEQIESMKILTVWLADKYKVSNEKIKAHDDYASTACPGKNLKSLMPELLKPLIKNPEPTTETNSNTNKKEET